MPPAGLVHVDTATTTTRNEKGLHMIKIKELLKGQGFQTDYVDFMLKEQGLKAVDGKLNEGDLVVLHYQKGGSWIGKLDRSNEIPKQESPSGLYFGDGKCLCVTEGAQKAQKIVPA